MPTALSGTEWPTSIRFGAATKDETAAQSTGGADCPSEASTEMMTVPGFTSGPMKPPSPGPLHSSVRPTVLVIPPTTLNGAGPPAQASPLLSVALRESA